MRRRRALQQNAAGAHKHGPRRHKHQRDRGARREHIDHAAIPTRLQGLSRKHSFRDACSARTCTLLPTTTQPRTDSKKCHSAFAMRTAAQRTSPLQARSQTERQWRTVLYAISAGNKFTTATHIAIPNKADTSIQPLPASAT